jgi:uncharacterized protein (TIGR02246 family)
MRRMMAGTLAGTVALAVAVGGCSKSNGAGASGNAQDATQAIKADEAKWNKQFAAQDQEGLVSHYAEDAYFVAPGVAGTEGATPIRQIFANASTDPAFQVHFSSDKIDVAKSGDLAYARGKFSENYTDKATGKVMSDSGSYITVYKKQDDGSWKAVEDFAAADPNSTKPVQPGKPATRAKMTSSGF